MGLVIVLPAAAAAPPLPPGLTAGGKEHGGGAPFEAILAVANSGAPGEQAPPGLALATALKAMLAGQAVRPGDETSAGLPAEDGGFDDELPALAGVAPLVFAGTPLPAAPVEVIDAGISSASDAAIVGADVLIAGVPSPGQFPLSVGVLGDAAPPLIAPPLVPDEAPPTVPTADASVGGEPGSAPGDAVLPSGEVPPPGILPKPTNVALERATDLSAGDAPPAEAPQAADLAAPGAGVLVREDAAVSESVFGERPAEEPAPAEPAGRLERANTTSAADEPAVEPPGDSASPQGPEAARARPGPGKEGNADVARVVRSVGNAKPEVDAAPAGPAGHPAAPAAVGVATASAAASSAQPAGQASGVPFREAAAPVPVAEQASQAIVESLNSGGGEVSIQLDPPELGEVTIRVVADGDSVQLVVRAERPEVVHLFRQAQADLASLLAQRGLELADLFVGNGRGEGQGSPDSHADSRGEPRTDFAAILTGGGAEHAAALSRHHRVRAAYNPDGALVYRV